MSSVITKPKVVAIWGESNTSSPDMVQPTYIPTGFPAPGGIPVKPPRGFLNWLFNFCMNAVRYFCVRGIADWDEDEDSYAPYAMVRESIFGNYYVLIGAATTGTAPSTDPTNWQVWLASPFALPTDYTNPIWAWHNEVKDRVFGIDHQGFPSGRIFTILEDWMDIVNGTEKGLIGSGSGAWFGKWNFGVFGGVGPIFASGAYPTSANGQPWGANCTIQNAGSGGGANLVEAALRWATVWDAPLSIDFDFSLFHASSTPAAGSSFAFGIGDGTITAGASTGAILGGGSAPSPAGAYFYLPAGGYPGNWQWHVKSGATNEDGDTGVAVAMNSIYRGRIDFIPQAASADSASHIIFFINGAVRANQTVIGSRGMSIWPFFRTSAAGGGDTIQLVIGPVRCQMKTVAGDILM